MYSILLNQTPSSGGALFATFVPMILLFVFMYFIMIRPQQKEEKKKALMLKELAVGDTVLTTSGFYGTIIDIADDTVIVEFGNNRNCRIPMQKAAVAMVEKAHEERYRALLKNVKNLEVFSKSTTKIWECRNCGHLHVGKDAPDICPVCAHPKAYFEIKEENY
jgi:preprotein translocase subunit YajC